MTLKDKYWESQWKIDYLEEYLAFLEELLDGYVEEALTKA